MVDKDVKKDNAMAAEPEAGGKRGRAADDGKPME
jgi:hypothetical protein